MSLAGTIDGLRQAAAGPQPPGQAVRARQFEHRRRAAFVGEFDAGVDVKYGVTSGLTLDFTVNTDFSQVEADEQQVNLTRFSLLFPEKREFFLENSGIFQFGLPLQRQQRVLRRRQSGGVGSSELAAGHAAVFQPADRTLGCRRGDSDPGRRTR